MSWTDVYFGRFKWYRKLSRKVWYRHYFTNDAQQLSLNFIGGFWATYGEINRYSTVITVENYSI